MSAHATSSRSRSDGVARLLQLVPARNAGAGLPRGVPLRARCAVEPRRRRRARALQLRTFRRRARPREHDLDPRDRAPASASERRFRALPRARPGAGDRSGPRQPARPGQHRCPPRRSARARGAVSAIAGILARAPLRRRADRRRPHRRKLRRFGGKRRLRSLHGPATTAFYSRGFEAGLRFSPEDLLRRR